LPECITLSEVSPQQKRERWLAQARSIFFATAYTKPPSSEAENFFKRWFGHYADTQPDAFLLASANNGDVVGYLAGCIDSYAAASRTITGAIDYFTPGFCAALKAYPSHFHINVKPGFQGQGIGHGLTARFAQLCAAAGSPGIHVVTWVSSPAVMFYEACGFKRLTPLPEASSEMAVLVVQLPGR
jgi:GNAT superfamily N-acetyltransferase